MSIQKQKAQAERRSLRKMEQERQNRCMDALLAEILGEDPVPAPRRGR